MAPNEAFYLDPTFWVAGSFIVFMGGVMYAKAHKSIANMLDERSDAIRRQIEDARQLRDDAEKLLSEYQRKQREAEKDAADMIAQAEEDAKLMAEQAKADLKALSARREKHAADKIAQAEALAIKEVQAVAVNVAVEAATSVLSGVLKGQGGQHLTDDAIARVHTQLN